MSFWGVFLAVVAALVVVGGLVAWSPWEQDTIGSNPQVPTGQCSSETTPNLTVNAIDRENLGTAVTEATNLYRKKGTNAWTSFTAGTAFAVSALETYEFVMGISTTDFTDNAYGQKFDYTVPCEETPTIEKQVANDEIETELTSTFYNADGAAAAEVFTAAQVQTISAKIKTGADQSFGNPYLPDNTPNVICLNLNTSEWDQPDQVYLVDGTELMGVPTPQRHSAVASMISYCYEAPVFDEKITEIFIDMDSDDTNAPATDMVMHIYAANWYINAKTGKLEYGVENEDGTAVGTDASDTLTLDFT